MIDLAALVKTTTDTASDLTNLVGIIEKNLASYERIRALFRRKRLLSRLSDVLKLLTRWRRNNRETLWALSEESIIAHIKEKYFIYPY